MDAGTFCFYKQQQQQHHQQQQQQQDISGLSSLNANLAYYSHNNNNYLSAVAGNDININAQVYLLYEVPITLLATRFNYLDRYMDDVSLKIIVSCTLYFISYSLFSNNENI